MSGTSRKHWTPARIESDVREIASALGYFPSASDLRDMGRNDLASQLGRSGGFIHWAERIGVSRRSSDSDTGWNGEIQVAARLKGFGFNVAIRPCVKCPFDLLLDDVLRIDVKSARYCRYGFCCGWFYRLGKIPQSDLILLWQIDTEIFHALPWYVCPTSNITITPTGARYEAYKNNIGIIRAMVDARKHEKSVCDLRGTPLTHN